MADNEGTPTEGQEGEASELTLESVDTFDVDNLSEDQTKFLEEHKGELTPEQQEKYGVKAEAKEEEVPEDLEPETRGGKPKEEKKGKETKEDEGDPDDEIDPDDEKMVSKVLKKNLGPVTEALEKMQSIQDQNEVNAFIRQNPTYAKFENVALKYMAHPAYKNIPVKNIMAIVSSDSAQKMGAQKEREAAAKAKETQNGGGQVRKPGGGAKIDWKTATPAEVEAEKLRVLQGARN